MQRVIIKLFFILFKTFKFNISKFDIAYQNYKMRNGKINFHLLGSDDFFLANKFYLQYLPDRYSVHFESYQKSVNFLCYDDLNKWVAGNYVNNIGDISRYFFLNLCIESLVEGNVVGNVAELGVFKGNSAFLLARYARSVNTLCYLFDTFEGFDTRDLSGVDSGVDQTQFSDTSLEFAKGVVGTENTVFVKGYFPESLEQITDVDLSFALVHIDCDLEKPFIASLEYFYPRLVRGGFLIMHDYSSLYWAGAKKAVDDFFKDKNEFVIPMPDKSGTCVIRKV